MPLVSINSWLATAHKSLTAAAIPSARLDAELILAHTIGRPRTWLHAHGNEELSSTRAAIATTRLSLRAQRVPLAYITGHKEFYGRRFHVTPAVLIPRPESEDLIDIMLSLPQLTSLLDVGCGSGVLGITSQLERPTVTVTLTDISQAALTVAQQNAAAWQVRPQLLHSDLLTNSRLNRYSIIIANLPYVDTAWATSPELQYEPDVALYASNHGLALMQHLLRQAPAHLLTGGYLLLEADPVQHSQLIATSQSHGFRYCRSLGYGLLLQLA